MACSFSCAVNKCNKCKGCQSKCKKDCSICLDKIEENDIIYLPCNHHFHKSCLLKWMNNDEQNPERKCPMCRKQPHKNWLKLNGIKEPIVEKEKHIDFLDIEMGILMFNTLDIYMKQALIHNILSCRCQTHRRLVCFFVLLYPDTTCKLFNILSENDIEHIIECYRCFNTSFRTYNLSQEESSKMKQDILLKLESSKKTSNNNVFSFPEFMAVFN